MALYKLCSKCKAEKLLSEFYKRHNRPSLMSYCKACIKLTSLKTQKTHPERHLENNRKYWIKHRDTLNAKHRLGKQLRKQQVAAYNKLYRLANREHRKEYLRNWRSTNPEKHVAALHRRRAGKGFSAAEFIALKKQCNYTCLACGKQEPEIKLTVDHIIPLSIGGNNNIENIQPLCGSCNSAKHTKIIDYRIRDGISNSEHTTTELRPLS